MKQRFSSHTTLIELAAALLCFLLASVTVLGLFSKAYTISRNGRLLNRATIFAQDCAEVVAGAADLEEALQQLGYEPVEDGVWRYRPDAELMVLLRLNTEQTEVGSLVSGKISVMREEEVLLEMETARYNNKEVIHS